MSNIRISELTAVADGKLTLEGVFPFSQIDTGNNDSLTTYKTTLQQIFNLFSAIFPTGLILPYGGVDVTDSAFSNTLKGWKLCDGNSLVRTNFPALFAAIGTTYGSIDPTSFKLPDLRGRTLIGAGKGTIPGSTTAFLSNYILGEREGAEAVGLGQTNMPPHGHPYNGVALRNCYGNRTNATQTVVDTIYNWNDGDPAHKSYTGLTGGSSGPNGDPHPNMQPYTVINYIIKT